ARGRNEDNARVARSNNRIAQGIIATTTAPGVVQDVRAFGNGIVDTLDCVRGEPTAAGVQEFQGHDLDVPSHAGNANAVVTHAADGAGNVRAVEMVVPRIATSGNSVYAMHIVAVNNAIDGATHARIHPQFGAKVFVVITH